MTLSGLFFRQTPFITPFTLLCVLNASFFLYPDTLYAARSSLPASLSARSALVMDFHSGKVLASRGMHTKRPPASTAKIVTALVVLDHLPLNKVITASAHAVKQPSTQIHVRQGERFYVKDLLKALLISSANDAAVVLAEGVAGSETAFAKLMTQKAHAVGARNSRFRNASGLPNGEQYSTAYDLAMLMRAAAKKSVLMNIMKTRTTSIRSLSGRSIALKNHNKMMWRDKRPLYGKTGWTRKSRHCFVGRVPHGRRDVCIVTMNATRPWTDLKLLLDYAYRTSSKAGVSGGEKDSVKTLQAKLKKLGYDPGPVDGEWGPRTHSAVIAFQRDHGLTVDGIAGRATWTKLETLT